MKSAEMALPAVRVVRVVPGSVEAAHLEDATALRKHAGEASYYVTRWLQMMRSGFSNWIWPSLLLTVAWLLRPAPWPLSRFWDLRVTLRSREGFRLLARLKDVPGPADVFGLGEYDFSVIDFDHVQTVVDVGAHVGGFSLWVAGRANCRVYSVEPNPETFALLGENVANANLGGRVTLQRAALAGEPGERTLHTDRYSTDAGIVGGRRTGADFSVEAVTLEQVVEASGFDWIDLLKVDVEGAEHELDDSVWTRSLERVGVLIVEWHGLVAGDHERLVRTLRGGGFRVAVELRSTDVLLVAWRPVSPAGAADDIVPGHPEQWRLLSPPGTVRVRVPVSRPARRRLSVQVKALPRGTPVALYDRVVGSRGRCDGFALAAGIRLDKHLLAAPSLFAPAYYIEDHPIPIAYFCRELFVMHRGHPSVTATVGGLLWLAQRLSPWRLLGAVAPVRLAIGRRA
ncbi:MAG: FkbM family methyltransferase [Candidatus Dormibacteraeota bacterium]|nr:FkbM family methyltransferase [Candidatus Dormibacteraeota bacterium]